VCYVIDARDLDADEDRARHGRFSFHDRVLKPSPPTAGRRTRCGPFSYSSAIIRVLNFAAGLAGGVASYSAGRSLRGVSSRMRAETPQSRRHSTAISASSRGIWRTRAPLV